MSIHPSIHTDGRTTIYKNVSGMYNGEKGELCCGLRYRGSSVSRQMETVDRLDRGLAEQTSLEHLVTILEAFEFGSQRFSRRKGCGSIRG